MSPLGIRPFLYMLYMKEALQKDSQKDSIILDEIKGNKNFKFFVSSSSLDLSSSTNKSTR